MPKVSSISRALGNVIVRRCCRTAKVARKGNQAILAPGQAIGRMTGDRQQESSVTAFVQENVQWLAS
jgi:hypothetical protein